MSFSSSFSFSSRLYVLSSPVSRLSGNWEGGRGSPSLSPSFVMIVCIFSRMLMNMDQINVLIRKKEGNEGRRGGKQGERAWNHVKYFYFFFPCPFLIRTKLEAFSKMKNTEVD